MKLKKLTQFLLVGCGVMALAGCATKHAPGAYGPGGVSGPEGAQASGIADAENFGSDGNGRGGNRARMARNGNTYYFDFDSNAVHPDDKSSIYNHANKLAANGTRKVIVEGHTDPRGSREYNVALGERRANAVADLMRSKGASAHQVRVVSYGAERPAADGHTDQDYQLDRRAVIEHQG